jgi:hypothetical protein
MRVVFDEDVAAAIAAGADEIVAKGIKIPKIRTARGSG